LLKSLSFFDALKLIFLVQISILLRLQKYFNFWLAIIVLTIDFFQTKFPNLKWIAVLFYQFEKLDFYKNCEFSKCVCEVKGKTKEGPGGRKRNKKSAALAFYFFPSSIFWGEVKLTSKMKSFDCFIFYIWTSLWGIPALPYTYFLGYFYGSLIEGMHYVGVHTTLVWSESWKSLFEVNFHPRKDFSRTKIVLCKLCVRFCLTQYNLYWKKMGLWISPFFTICQILDFL